MILPEQLTFDLAVEPALGREDFFVSPSNSLALATLDAWEVWPNKKCILVGPEGSGKTHLAHVWAAKVGAEILAADELNDGVVASLATKSAIVVEDADKMHPEHQEPLFHLHNALASAGAALLLTASKPPAVWPLTLPDLRSRMEATATAEIKAPDDALLLAVMIKLFADRQIDVPANLPSYVLARLERSFEAVRAFVDALDRAALEAKAPITRALAADLLDKFHNPGA